MVYEESCCCLTPLSETFAREGVAERIMALARDTSPSRCRGPTASSSWNRSPELSDDR